MEKVIEVEHLRKRYGRLVAVADVSFSVSEGEIFGLLGRNGVGKTTVQCLQGLRPSPTECALGKRSTSSPPSARRAGSGAGCSRIGGLRSPSSGASSSVSPPRSRTPSTPRSRSPGSSVLSSSPPSPSPQSGCCSAPSFLTARAAQGAGALLWFVMMILGGAGPPPEVLTGALGVVAKVTPAHHAVLLLQGPWLGFGWDTQAMLVLLGFLAVSALLTVRFFRWD